MNHWKEIKLVFRDLSLNSNTKRNFYLLITLKMLYLYISIDKTLIK